MSKRQEGDGLKRRIKTFLGIKKNVVTGSNRGNEEKETEDFIFTEDVLKEVGKDNNATHRGKKLKELCEVVTNFKLEDHAIEAVWNEIEDLLQASSAAEPRQSVLKFLIALVTGQYARLGMLRAQFFRLVENHNVKEDLSYRVELLKVLTDNGKDVSYCEQIGSFLLTFMPEALVGDRVDEFLRLLINIVHYNSSFLDKEIIADLIKQTCDFCNKAKAEKEIESCLQLLDATIRYGGNPTEGLYPLIDTLCRTVNIEKFCQASWKLMKALVGTRNGHTAVYIMCCILEDDNNMNDSILLRGAVFFIGMCIWGSKRVATLRHRPISLLPSFKQALHCNHPIVAHEISLSLQRLVKKYGTELEVVTWDLVLDLTEMLLKLQQNLSSNYESLQKTIHDLLTTIEELYNAGKFEGSADRLFSIIEKCSSIRPETSIISLLSFMNGKIHPAREGWMETLKTVLEKYFKKESRTLVRVKVLDILSAVFRSFRHWYEDEIIEFAILPYLNSIYEEKDANVRLVAAQLLVDLVKICSSNRCADILRVLGKLLNRLMDATDSSMMTTEDQITEGGDQIDDIQIATVGLVDAFKQKLFESPATIAVHIYEILVSHVSAHYVHGFTAQTASLVRKEIFQLFLSLRADSLHRTGVQCTESDGKSERIRHSVFVVCTMGNIPPISGCDSRSIALQRRLSLTKECPFYKAFDAILNCLKDEWDWIVLEYVLNALPEQLRNKTLILGGQADATTLCALLCKMVNDRMYLNKVRNVPPGSGKHDLHNLIFPILAVLATYHNAIDRNRQFDLVKTLEFGLNSQCARTCVICLTICTLEMQSVMLRLLPSVLVKLSTISNTVPMSIPMLEFLSSLKEVPNLYSNFVEEQYMSIFAIALPYTDSYKYTTYTVTLAHYVITAWFTRCRLPFRKGFVKLITLGLKSSAIPYHERSKTSSTQISDKKDITTNKTTEKTKEFQKTKDFHEEMTQVCLDMMAKYSFATISSQPKRSQAVDFLLSSGICQSWLVGNSIVTVTTSRMADEDCSVCTQQRNRKAAMTANTAGRVRQMLSNTADGVRQMLSTEEEGKLERRATVQMGKLERRATVPMGTHDASGCCQNSKDMHEFVVDATNESVNAKDSGKDQLEPVPDHDTRHSEDPTKKPIGAENNRRERDENNRRESDEELFQHQDKNVKSEATTTTIEPIEQFSDELLIAKNVANSAGITSNKLLFNRQSMPDKATLFGPMPNRQSSPDDASPLSEQLPDKATLFGPMPDKATLFGPMPDKATLFGPMPDKATLFGQSCPTTSAFEKYENIADLNVSKSFTDSLVKETLEIDKIKTEGGKCGLGKGGYTNDAPKTILASQAHTVTQKNLTTVGVDLASDSSGWTDINGSGVSEKRGPPSQITPGIDNISSKSLANKMLISTTEVYSSGQTSASEFEVINGEDELITEMNAGGHQYSGASLCNCSCEGWAEILIRRATGNTSWVMKMENSADIGCMAGKLDDVMALAVLLEKEESKGSLGNYFDPSVDYAGDTRPIFLSVLNDELIKERHSSRTSSDSTKRSFRRSTRESPILRRRRFSTGSLEIPGAFKFREPSPDPNKELDGTVENSLTERWVFEKPTVGRSPMDRLRRQESWTYNPGNRLKSIEKKIVDDIREAPRDGSGKELVPEEHIITTTTTEEKHLITSQTRTPSPIPKPPLRKTHSVPTFAKEGNLSVLRSSTAVTSQIKTREDPAKQRQSEDPAKQRQSGDPAKQRQREDPAKQRQSEDPAKQRQSEDPAKLRQSEDPAKLRQSEDPAKQRQSEDPAKQRQSEDPAKQRQSEDPAKQRQSEDPAKQRQSGEGSDVTVEKAQGSKTTETIVKTVHLTPDKGEDQDQSKVKETHDRTAPRVNVQSYREKLSNVPSYYRARGQTIATSHPITEADRYICEPKSTLTERPPPFNPYYVFLQLFYSPFLGNTSLEKPILLQTGEVINRSIKMLDRIPPFDTNKIGVLYVGAEQEENEAAILANEFGSSRYAEFLRGLGSLVSLADCSPTEVYTGGLDRRGADGKFAYSCKDDTTQVIFHVATLMPKKPSDAAGHSKKLHIGNNFVTIVYNDSKRGYKFGTIRGQFNFAEVLIKPLDNKSNLVCVRVKEDLKDIVTNTGPHVISDTNLPILVKQLAIHTNMATVIHHSQKTSCDAYGCNWLERLRQIKRIRSKSGIDNQDMAGKSAHLSFRSSEYSYSDFIDYTVPP